MAAKLLKSQNDPAEDIDVFIGKVDLCAETNGWDDSTTASRALEALNGKASVWAENLKIESVETLNSWSKLKQGLLNRFASKQSVIQQSKTMMGLKQKAHENESLEDFYDRVQATLYSLEQPILAECKSKEKASILKMHKMWTSILFVNGLPKGVKGILEKGLSKTATEVSRDDLISATLMAEKSLEDKMASVQESNKKKQAEASVKSEEKAKPRQDTKQKNQQNDGKKKQQQHQQNKTPTGSGGQKVKVVHVPAPPHVGPGAQHSGMVYPSGPPQMYQQPHQGPWPQQQRGRGQPRGRGQRGGRGGGRGGGGTEIHVTYVHHDQQGQPPQQQSGYPQAPPPYSY